MLTKRILLILAVLLCLPIAAIGIVGFQSRRPAAVSGCPDWILSEIKSGNTLIHPERVVVEPWQGRHNVFATFKVPAGYQESSIFVVTLHDANPYCGEIRPYPSASDSNREVLGVFRTRTTLWLMARGLLNQLEEPSNWKLMIVKNS
jgi:hypothetical protein